VGPSTSHSETIHTFRSQFLLPPSPSGTENHVIRLR